MTGATPSHILADVYHYTGMHEDVNIGKAPRSWVRSAGVGLPWVLPYRLGPSAPTRHDASAYGRVLRHACRHHRDRS
jgi:hypothetical protein